jgi:hypothetical protein
MSSQLPTDTSRSTASSRSAHSGLADKWPLTSARADKWPLASSAAGLDAPLAPALADKWPLL